MRHQTQIMHVREVYPADLGVIAEYASCSCGWRGPDRAPRSGNADRDGRTHRSEPEAMEATRG